MRRRWRERLEALEARVDDLESPEWKPGKVKDHSGVPVDAQALWREAVGEYATFGEEDECWNPRSYI